MTTLAADAPRAYEQGYRNEFPIIANKIIFEGAAVGDNGAGYARPLVAGDPFRGFAEKKADNSVGVAGAATVRVKDHGKIQLPVTGVVITSVGATVYASDDNTFTLTASTNTAIGKVARFVSAGVAVVNFKATQNA